MKKLILLSAAMLTLASTAFAQFGYSTTSDAVFTPVAPCRLFDTRPSQGGTGPIAAAGTKVFAVWGQTTYTAQGGAATNCGLDAAANTEAIAMNFTVVTPAAGGFITAYPFGGALPVAATVNFQAGDIARGDFTIAKVTQTGTSHLSIYSTSNADVVGDVVGYFARPKASNLSCTNPPESTLVVAPGVLASLPIPACPATNSYSSIGGYCFTDGAEMQSYTGSQGGECKMKNLGSVSATMTAGRRCCGVAGR